MVNKSVQLKPREVIEAQWPTARFLSEQEQATYEEAVKSRFNSEKARKTLTIPEKGSSLFKILFLNDLGIRTATLPELDLAHANDPDFLKGVYADAPEVVLRSAGDSYERNDFIAKQLAKAMKKRKFNHSWIVKGLKPVEDENSAYGLSLEPTEGFESIEAPDFDNENNGRSFSRINPDYSIEWEGNRTFYAKQKGLSRWDLDDSDLGSSWGSLGGSGSSGRVVVIDAKGVAPANLGQYFSKLEAERKKQLANVEERFSRAINVLKQ